MSSSCAGLQEVEEGGTVGGSSGAYEEEGKGEESSYRLGSKWIAVVGDEDVTRT